MPELPEVETVRRTLQQLVSGKTISSITVSLPRIIKEPDNPELFIELLKGQTIRKMGRRGKFLKFYFDDFVLLSHLRMEGRYGVYGKEEQVEKHTHVIFHFTDETELRYRDVRTFGTMHLYKQGDEEKAPSLAKLGLEPLDPQFTPDELQRRMKGRTSKIKALLLNQEIVAGLGNIYVDECLYQAKIHPEKTPSQLKEKDWTLLHHSIVDVLSRSITLGGSSVKSYVNGQGEEGKFQHTLKVYQKKGEPCAECGTPIVRTVVSGRGTHYCPQCQLEN
ncbi:MAG TPA: DNA-formamidopyrimidine glycosylase [Paenibacillaceae bacterium]|nr:DNA-formamidopyrimidine glycosylase [Paenibacillaceae bacterium]